MEIVVFIFHRMNPDSENNELANTLSIEKETGKVFVADLIDFESIKVKLYMIIIAQTI